MTSVAAVVLLTLGALNAALALSLGTCTQGDAGELYLGFLTLIFYLAGLAALLAAPATGWSIVALVPAMAIAIWHSWFSIRFAYGYAAQGMSACYAKTGGFRPEDAGEWMDGSEPMYILLWLAMSLLFWAGIGRFILRVISSRSEAA